MLVVWSGLAAASAPEVPAAVQEAFRARYPVTNKVRWRMDKGVFVARFRNAEGVHRAFFHADGRWVETRTALTWQKLPGPVRQTLASGYGHTQFKGAHRLMRPGQAPLFEVEAFFIEDQLVLRLDMYGAVQDAEIIPARTGLGI